MRRRCVALAILVVVLTAGVREAEAAEVARGEVAIVGSGLEVDRTPVAAATSVPSSLQTFYGGLTAPDATAPPGVAALGDLTGPGIGEPLTLSTVPGGRFSIPALHEKGEYTLQNIRLVAADGSFLQPAVPSFATILVADVLATDVRVRQLTAAELRERGIALDSSWEVYEYVLVIAIEGGELVEIPYIVTIDKFSGAVLPPPSGGQAPPPLPETGPRRRWSTPVPRFFDIGPADLPLPGDEKEEAKAAVPRLPAALVIPSGFGVLHQFFAVVLRVANAAEAATVRLDSVTATIASPSQLRVAQVIPAVAIGQPVPIVDEESGATYLVAGAQGSAEWTLEALRSGTHAIEVEVRATYQKEGEPDYPMSGRVSAAIVVSDPRFQINFSHPDVVREGPYTAHAFITNLSEQSQHIALDLREIPLCTPPPGIFRNGICRVDGEGLIELDLQPGEMTTVPYRLRSSVIGRAYAAAGTSSDEALGVSVALTMGVDPQMGIPLSPATLVMPHYAQFLPQDLVSAQLELLGIGYSLATAPLNKHTATQPRVITSDVFLRAQQIARAGQRIFVTRRDPAADDPPQEDRDALAHLALDLLDNTERVDHLAREPGLVEWDELRRTHDSARRAAASVARELERTAPVDPQQFVDGFASATAHRSPFFFAWVRGAPVPGNDRPYALAIEGMQSGARLDVPSEAAEGFVRDLPFAELTRLSIGGEAGELALAGRWQEPLRLSVVPASPSFTLHLVYPDLENGSFLRADIAVTDAVPGVATLIDVARGARTLALQNPARVVTATPVAHPALTLLGAAQDLYLDGGGHVVSLLFNRPATVDDVAAWRDRVALTVDVPKAGYTEVRRNDAARGARPVFAAIPQEDGRILNVTFDKILSRNADYRLGLDSTVDRLSGAVTPSFDIVPRIDNDRPGAILTGRVMLANNAPASGALVGLTLPHAGGISLADRIETHEQAYLTGPDGRFLFEYVSRDADRGYPGEYTLAAQLPDGKRTAIDGAVRLPGEVHTVNLVFVGRGVVQGHVRYDDGAVIANARVIATSPLHHDMPTVYTNPDGRFGFEAGVGPWTLTAFDSDNRPTFLSTEVRWPGEVVTEELIIQRRSAGGSGTLKVVVVRASDRLPIPRASVAIAFGYPIVASGYADENGAFFARDVPAGVVTILARHEEWTAAVEVDLRADQTLEQIIVIDTSPVIQYASLRGVVTRDDPSAPNDPSRDEVVSGALVAIQGLPTVTAAADGSFVVDRIPTAFSGHGVLVYDPGTGRRGASAVPSLTANETAYLPIRLSTTVTGEATMRVRLFSARGDAVSNWNVFVPTDPPQPFAEKGSGVYELAGMKVPQGAGVIAIAKSRNDPLGDQYAEGSVRVDFDGQVGVTDLRLPGSGTIAVRIENEQPCGSPPCYAPAAGRVRLSYLFWDPFVHGPATRTLDVETDTQTGYAMFPNIPARQTLTVATVAHPLGYAEAQARLEYDGDAKEVVLRLAMVSEIEGRVLAFDGRTPVHGATVRLVTGNFADATQVTGEDGAFRFPAVAADLPFRVIAEVSSDGVYRTGQIEGRTPPTGGPVSGLRVTMREQSSVEGRIVDAGGVPVPLARYWLAELAWPYRQIGTKLTPQQADAAGRFVVSNVFAGAFRITAVDPDNQELRGDYQGKIAEEGDASQRNVEIVIGAGGTGSIAVTVVDPLDGFAPVENAEVALLRDGARFDFASTNAVGTAFFGDVPAGSYSVRAWSKARARGGESEVFDVVRDVASSVSVELDFRGVVAGYVTDPESEPSPDVRVTGEPVTVSGASYTLRDSTDANGEFEFIGIPEEAFTIFARESETERVAVGPSGLFISRLVPEQRNLHLELERFARLTVRVHLPDDAGGAGELAPIADVTATQLTTEWGNNGYGRAAQGNPVSFERMVHSRGYSLDVRELGGEARRVRVEGFFLPGVYDHEQVVVLPASGTLEVLVHDSAGTPVGDALVSVLATNASFAMYSGPDGIARMRNVPFGPVSVRASKGSVSAAGSGDITSRSLPLHIALSLGANATVRGTVEAESPRGSPSSGTRVVLHVTSRLLTSTLRLETITDVDGAYAFAGIPVGGTTLSLVYYGPDETTVGAAQTVAIPDETTSSFTLPGVRLDATPPRILSIDPPANSTDASPATVITIVFSEQIAGSFLGPSWFDLRAAGATTPLPVEVQGSVRTDGTYVVRLIPPPPPPSQRFALESNMLYRLAISDAITDVTGHRLRQPVGTSFTTVDYTEPAIVAVSPAENEPLIEGQTFRVRFNKPIDLASFEPGNGGILALDRLASRGGTTIEVLPVQFYTDPIDVATLVIAPEGVAIEPASFYRLTIGGARDLSSPPNVQKETRVFDFVSLDTDAPTVRIVSPVAADAPLVSGILYTVTADVTDASGGAAGDVAYVDWLDAAGVSRGRASTPPFAFEFVAPESASFTLQASATDLSSNTSDVASLTWNVIPNAAPRAITIASTPASAYPSTAIETRIGFEDEGLAVTVLLRLRGIDRDGATIDRILGSQKVVRSTTSEAFAPATIAWSVPLEIATGTATLAAEVTDSIGQSGVAETAFDVVRDDLAPEILSLLPEAESRFRYESSGSSYTIEIAARDRETGIASVQFRVDGALIAEQPAGDGEVDPDSDIVTFRQPVTVPPRNADTRVSIAAVVVDHAGNETARTHDVIYERVDDASVPEAAWITPLDGAALPSGLQNRTVPLRVRATDDVKVTAVRFESDALAGPIVLTEPLAGTSDVFGADVALSPPPDGSPFELIAVVSDGDPLHDVELRITIEPFIAAVVISGDLAITAANVAQFADTQLVIRNAAVYCTVPLAVTDLALIDGAVLSAPDETALDLTVTDRLFVEMGSSIDVSGKGWLGGLRAREDNAYRNESRAGMTDGRTAQGGAVDAAASHAGIGGASFGITNATYGSIVEPTSFGSGGGAHPTDARRGANGGGAVLLRAGTGIARIVIAGAVRADAEPRIDGVHWRAGAGGSVNIRAQSLITGAGTRITANGGDDVANAVVDAGGGGGRIVVRASDRLDLVSPWILQARGGRNGTTEEGTQYVDGGAGTILLERPGAAAVLQITSVDERFPSTAHRTAGTPVADPGAFARIEAGPRALVRFDGPFSGDLQRDATAEVVDQQHTPTVTLDETAPVAGSDVPRGAAMDVTFSHAAVAGVRELRVQMDGNEDVVVYPAFAESTSGASARIDVADDAPIGPAQLRLTVLDRAGVRVQTPPIAFTIVDNALPSIDAFEISPSGDVHAGRRLSVRAVASDDVGISNLELIASAGSVAVVMESASGNQVEREFDVLLPRDLAGGTTVELTLVARDGFPGHDPVTAAKTIAILKDTAPPVLNVVEPLEGAEIAEGAGATFEVVVEAIDVEVAVREAVATWNGVGVALVESEGLWRATLPVPAVDGLDPVPFTLQLRAADYAGNESTASVAVHVIPLVDPDAAVLEWVCGSPGMLVPAGDTIALRVSATPSNAANGVSAVAISVDGGEPVAATNVGGTIWELSYATPADAPDGTEVAVRVSAVTVAGNESTLPGTLMLVTGTRILTASLLAETDLSFEDQTLIVGSGGVLTIDGPHRLRDLVVLDGGRVVQRHPGQVQPVTVRRLSVACGGAIDVSGLGYVRGTSYPAAGVPDDQSGGSHIGRGGVGTRAAGATFGSIERPVEMGGGGHATMATPGSAAGGGVVRIEATESIAIDGAVRANGHGTGTNVGGGGAGGSVWMISDGAFSGAGTIEAAGSNDGRGRSAGGGGAVSLAFASRSGTLWSHLNASGGASGWPTYAGAGSIYLRSESSRFGDLVIDNRGQTSSLTQTALPSFGRATVSAVDGDGVTLDAVFHVSPALTGHGVRIFAPDGTSHGTARIASIENDPTSRAIDGFATIDTQDAVAYDGWIVHSPLGIGGRAFVAARRAFDRWEYDDGSAFLPFNPQSGDAVIASFSKDAAAITSFSTFTCEPACPTIEGLPALAVVAGDIAINASAGGSSYSFDTGIIDPGSFFVRPDAQGRSLILSTGAESRVRLEADGDALPAIAPGDIVHGLYRFDSITLRSASVVSEDLVESTAAPAIDAQSSLVTGNATVPQLDRSALSFVSGTHGPILAGGAGSAMDPEGPVDVVAGAIAQAPHWDRVWDLVIGKLGGLSIERHVTAQWAGLSTLDTIDAFGHVEFSPMQTTVAIQVGLAPGDTTLDFNEPGVHAFRLETNGTYRIILAGVLGPAGSYTPATVFRIERMRERLLFIVDGKRVHETTVDAAPLRFDMATWAHPGGIRSVEFVNGEGLGSRRTAASADGSFRAASDADAGEPVRIRLRDRHRFTNETPPLDAGILPPDLGIESFTIEPQTIISGSSATGRIVLGRPAAIGGAVIDLDRGDAPVTMPPSVTIAAGATTAVFTIGTEPVTVPVDLSLTARWGPIARNAALRIEPDVAPPDIAVTSPLAGDTFVEGWATQIAVAATIVDADSGVARAWVALDGREYELVASGETFSAVIPAPFVEATASMPLVVHAEDRSGNRGSQSVMIDVEPIVDTATPSIGWLCGGGPAIGVSGGTVKLRVQANGPDATNVIERVTIEVDGATSFEATRVDSTNTYELLLPLPVVTADTVLQIRAAARTASGTTASITSEIEVLVDALEVRGNQTITSGDATYEGRSIVVHPGATLTIAGTHRFDRLAVFGVVVPSPAQPLDVELARLFLDCDGVIDADALGYPIGSTYPGADPATGVASGASHIGRGAFAATLTSGSTYGSIRAPRELGAGNVRNHPGGGAIHIAASDTIAIDGVVRANGRSGGGEGGGAGGSILLTADRLGGNGVLEADGGSACWGGGGGAIGIEHTSGSVNGLQMRARGGTSCAGYSAGAGSVFVRDGSALFGTLALDSGGRGTGIVELPALGSGAAQSGTTGAMLVTHLTTIPSYFAGHHVRVTASDGTERGTWRIESIDGATLHLAGNSGEAIALQEGDSWRGVYRFDRLVLRDVELSSADLVDSDVVDVNGVVVTTALTGGSIVVRDQAVLSHPKGALLTIEARDGLRIDGSIDVTARGYAPPQTGEGALSAQIVQQGGSHLGRGGNVTAEGATFGSMRTPFEAGAGDYRNHFGGGAVRIVAGEVTLIGAIRANGGSGGGEGAGAGGSIDIVATRIDGGGTIEAEGGSACWGGGGGAIAITTGDGSAPDATVRARGGASCTQPAGAGTILVNGDLTIDNDARGVGTTELPSLGSGIAQPGSSGATLVTERSSTPAWFVGHAVEIASSSGTTRGIWRIVAVSDGTLTLEPSADVQPGDTWKGVYAAGTLTLRSTTLFSRDEVRYQSLDQDGASSIATPP